MILRMWRRTRRICSVVFILIREEWRGCRLSRGLGELDRARVFADVTRRWGASLMRSFDMTLHIHGSLEEYRLHGGLIVSNHQGYLDIPVHAAVIGLRFMPKIEIRSWPFLGPYVASTNPIWVDRKNKQSALAMGDRILESLRNKIPLIVYPEGTSTDGLSGLLPFKAAPFEPVAGTGIPVQPILTLFRFHSARDVNPAWFGSLTFLPHLWKVLGNGPMDVDVYILPPVSTEGRSRKELALLVHDLLQHEYELRLNEPPQKG